MNRWVMVLLLTICLFALIKLMWLGQWNEALVAGTALAGFMHEYDKHKDSKKRGGS